MERIRAILLIAGVFFFALAFALMGILPIMSLRDIPTAKLEEIATEVPLEWNDMATRWPAAFKAEIGEPSLENWRTALRHGRQLYIGEACWHCHSQYVRPVSNESMRFGAVSTAEEYQNEMQMPVLFGTRRVGPDLTREGGKRPNDWHAAHLWNPQNIAPVSVMPRYPWFFGAASGNAVPAPNKDGFSVLAYIQWLGTWKRSELEGEGGQP